MEKTQQLERTMPAKKKRRYTPTYGKLIVVDLLAAKYVIVLLL